MQITPSEFCHKIYNTQEWVLSYAEDISVSEMSQYIKDATNNYEKSSFEYLISEIRNFAQKLEFKILNPGVEINDLSNHDILYKADSFELKMEFGLSFNFETNITLRERIREIKEKVPGAIFKASLTDVLVFSEMAERQYRKSIEKSHDIINNRIFDHLSDQFSTPAKKSPIKQKKDYIDLNILDFCRILYPGKDDMGEYFHSNGHFEYKETESITKLEMYQYLKHNSNNFGKTSFEFLIREIRDFGRTLTFHLPEIYQNGTMLKILWDFECDYFGYPMTDPDAYYEIIANQPEFSINTISEWDGCSQSMYRLQFHISQHLTLNEIHRLILDKIPLATFRIGIEKLLEFSELSEIMFEKINEKKPNNSSIHNLTTVSQLTQADIALICIYQGIIINKSNGDEILTKYAGKGSLKKLIEKYNFYQLRGNRVYCDESKSDLAKEKRLIKVIEYLNKNDLKSDNAVNDLTELQKNMKR